VAPFTSLPPGVRNFTFYSDYQYADHTLDPDGDIYRFGTPIFEFADSGGWTAATLTPGYATGIQGPTRIWMVTVPEGRDRSVWRLRRHAGRHAFLDIPNIFARAPAQLLVPSNFWTT
jgi:hypothetical protein